MELSDLQRKFVAEYLIDFDPGAAALRAGYSGARQGHALITMPEIQAAITAAQEERAARLQVNVDWVTQNLREIVERCMRYKPVYDSKGQPVLVETEFGEVCAVYKFEPTAANKALELLGKHVGMFVDRVEHSGEVATHDMSENEIARRVAYILHTAVKQRQETLQ
jgi:phage terminase small subunit